MRDARQRSQKDRWEGEEACCVLRGASREIRKKGRALTRYRAHLGKGGRAGEGERKVGEVGEQDEHHPVRGDQERPFSATRTRIASRESRA